MKQYIISLNENELNQILDDMGEIYGLSIRDFLIEILDKIQENKND